MKRPAASTLRSLKQPALAVALWFYCFEFRRLYSCSYHSSNERLIGHFSGRECIRAAVSLIKCVPQNRGSERLCNVGQRLGRKRRL
jgi:hypothetical protein